MPPWRWGLLELFSLSHIQQSQGWAELTGETSPRSCPQGARLGIAVSGVLLGLSWQGASPSNPHSLLLFCNWLQRIRRQ